MDTQDPIPYLKRLHHQGDTQATQMMRDRDAVLGEYGHLFHPDNLPRLTAADFKAFLLYENNRHWWGIHRHQRTLVADMGRLRHVLGVLLDEGRPIAERVDWVEPSVGRKPLPGLGKAVFTPILHVVYPERYGVWNSIAESALRRLGLWPGFLPGTRFGGKYELVNQALVEAAAAVGVDLWTIDILWWLVEKDHEPTRHQFDGGTGSSGGESRGSRSIHARDTFVCQSCFRTKAGSLRSETNPANCQDCEG